MSDPDPRARRGRRIRVLVVIKVLGYGGAERLLVDTMATADQEAFDYEVAYVLAAEHALASRISDLGFAVHALGAQGDFDLRWMSRLRRLLRQGRFDVVHFHLPYTAAVGRLVARSLSPGRRPAVVYTEHSLWNKMAVLVKGLNRAGVAGDDALLVVSDAAFDALPPPLKGRAQVVVHGIDLAAPAALVARRAEVRAEVRAELGVGERELLAISVANFRPEKGYDVLLEAARQVTRQRPDVRFVAVGRGPLEDDVRSRLDALDLGDRFQLLGQRHDVLRLLAGSDLFVLASRQEGLPVALMEATSVGLPVVATAVGGVPQAVANGTAALIVPPGQPGELADAIVKLADDPELRRRLADGSLASSRAFDVTAATRRIEAIYCDIVEGRA